MYGYITSSPDPLQWMGAVRMTVKTTDAILTCTQHNSRWSIHCLWREKPGICNKQILQDVLFYFKPLNIWQPQDSVCLCVWGELGVGGVFDPLLILYVCWLTKKCSVYNFNGRFIWTVSEISIWSPTSLQDFWLPGVFYTGKKLRLGALS